ncbi:helix-turn-helix domain-containing protein [Lentzea sp. CC55]|uniref:helix-turn-helix domain-containing protein n=1 Tax=Lentzea sp. CC55 TaxID=2884909 RepID=UPI0027E11458|nr:AraC family transcriptional regulator [Lentzea sp. CC55]MCG8927829.1 AraC family transcriptional regulator [Lentzea sp. CC55]
MRQDAEVAGGVLVVRASGAAAARAALTGSPSTPQSVQLLMRCPVHRSVPGNAHVFGDCSLHVLPVGTIVLTVPEAKLSTGFTDLRRLMFQPVEVGEGLRTAFSSAVGHVLAARDVLDPVGVAHHLVGLAEMVLRSALRDELERADIATGHRRAALEHIRAHLADPSLTPGEVARALNISLRRLYQVFEGEPNVAERIKVLRIDRAKALLADPAKADRGVGEISRDCGFVSATHFSRAFRALVGQPPTEYRRHALPR